jgi:hypothetical protein
MSGNGLPYEVRVFIKTMHELNIKMFTAEDIPLSFNTKSVIMRSTCRGIIKENYKLADGSKVWRFSK